MLTGMTAPAAYPFVGARTACASGGVAVVLAVGQWVARALRGEALFSDDAYYYTISARHFAATGLFTFDGEAEMHGFHPLWFWMQVAGFGLLGTGASPLATYQLALLTQAAAVLAGAGLCAGLVLRSGSHERDALFGILLLSSVLALLLLPLNLRALLSGMELAISMPVSLALAMLVWKRRFAAAGVVAALLVAARLDTLVYVVAPLALATAASRRARPGEALRTGIALAAPALAATLAFLAWHRTWFGYAMPIHGTLKSSFPLVHWQWHQLVGLGFFEPWPPFVALLALLVSLPLLASGTRRAAIRNSGLAAALLCSVQLAAFLLFQKWTKPVPPWYWGLPQLCAGFALLAGVAARFPRAFRQVPLLLALGSLGLQLQALPGTARELARIREAGPHHWFDPVVRFMQSRPEGERWAATDAGAFAFWSGRPVVNLDGLVNDRAYQETLCQAGLAAALRERAVRYLILGVWDRPQLPDRVYEPMYAHRVAPRVFAGDYERAGFFVHSYWCEADSEVVSLPRSAEIWRSPPGRDGRARSRWVVFDLRLAGVAAP
jgi:hypothetical protein